MTALKLIDVFRKDLDIYPMRANPLLDLHLLGYSSHLHAPTKAPLELGLLKLLPKLQLHLFHNVPGVRLSC